jgi:nucleoside-diphosphate-sugar epimerase/glycosyltransferase involved in cell wall biosynthesis
MTPEEKIKKIRGPILVLGASGFIGANLLKMILKYRNDAFGTVFHFPSWRLEDLPANHVLHTDLLVDENLDSVLQRIDPKTIFDCVAYGAYSFETNSSLIYRTNFILTEKILQALEPRDIAGYIHSGSSSEYGDNASGPTENDLPAPNSDYAVSKVATANLLFFYGRKKNLPCANLRLYSVYGPLEDSSRLIPRLIEAGQRGKYPELVNPDVSRDFVYIDDVCEAFLDTAMNLKPSHYGDSFNIGSGKKTTIREAAEITGKVFRIETPPMFNSMPDRKWDVKNWFADTHKAKELLNWESHVSFHQGLKLTASWYEKLENKEKYRKSSKQFELDSKHSLSAVIVCYKNAPNISIIYERVKTTFEKLKIDYEIIFVNDNSPDNSEEMITELSRKDGHVVGVSQSSNFGAQAAYRSGLEISTKNGCVLLNADLQDPPELIEKFIEKWREGYDVVFGRRIKSAAPLYAKLAYKLFYFIFDYFSYLAIPHDAGDFSLIDRRVVKAILQFQERTFFLRGVRAYVGFKQIGVDYVRSEKVPGKNIGNFFKNIESAKKGILSYSYTPLSILSFSGSMLFFFSLALAVLQIAVRLIWPDRAPKGTTTLLLSILFFGSINLFAVAILGEYIAKIFEEVKQRPHFVRKSIIKGGESRSVIENS